MQQFCSNQFGYRTRSAHCPLEDWLRHDRFDAATKAHARWRTSTRDNDTNRAPESAPGLGLHGWIQPGRSRFPGPPTITPKFEERLLKRKTPRAGVKQDKHNKIQFLRQNCGEAVGQPPEFFWSCSTHRRPQRLRLTAG